MPKSVFTDAYAALTTQLVQLRKSHGVTQAELAKRLGKPQQFISYVEKGERRIDVVEFYAITRALGVDPVQTFADVVARFPDDVQI